MLLLTRNFLLLARQNSLGIFEIERPYYGHLRGEVISVMKCQEKYLKVANFSGFCTKEVQVITSNGDHDEKLMFVTLGSRILQETYTKIGKGSKIYSVRIDSTAANM